MKKETEIEKLDSRIKSNDGGMYAVFPYEHLDKQGKGIFKVGQTVNYRDRFEQYHTYYPMGVTYKNLLLNPRDHNDGLTKKAYYNEVERYIEHELQEEKARRLYTTTRVKNVLKNKEQTRQHLAVGDTEFWYASPEMLDKAFVKAHKIYGSYENTYKIVNGKRRQVWKKIHEPFNYDLEEMEKGADKRKRNATYNAEIYYHVPRLDSNFRVAVKRPVKDDPLLKNNFKVYK
jgi:T5orf172 domain